MFDKLIDLLIEFIGLFKFWVVIDTYEKGVVLQFGKYRRTLDAGIYFVCPFAIDQILSDNVVLKTMNMGNQSLHDTEFNNVIIGTMITYRIIDIKTFLLNVESAEDVMMSSTYGVISKAIMGAFWTEIRTAKFRKNVRDKIKTKLLHYGVELIDLDFQNLTDSKTQRFLTDDITLNMVDE